jgi:hypothetical protein
MLVAALPRLLAKIIRVTFAFFDKFSQSANSSSTPRPQT